MTEVSEHAASASDELTTEAVLPVDLFVEAFVAKLVSDGMRQLATRLPKTRRGFGAVVQLLDEHIRRFEIEDRPWEDIWPWVQTVNRLRLSSMGGVENWDHHLRSAQGVLTRVLNPTYERVDLAIDPITAAGELRKLRGDQHRLIDSAVARFKSEYAQAR